MLPYQRGSARRSRVLSAVRANAAAPGRKTVDLRFPYIFGIVRGEVSVAAAGMSQNECFPTVQCQLLKWRLVTRALGLFRFGRELHARFTAVYPPARLTWKRTQGLGVSSFCQLGDHPK